MRISQNTVSPEVVSKPDSHSCIFLSWSALSSSSVYSTVSLIASFFFSFLFFSLLLLTPVSLVLNSWLSCLKLGPWPMSRCHIALALQTFDPSQSVRWALLVGQVYLTPSGTLTSNVLHPVTSLNRAPPGMCTGKDALKC